jgi:sulfoxide reductase heme-binding subunit YedZ
MSVATFPRPALRIMLVASTATAMSFAPELFQAIDEAQPLQWWAGRATGFLAYIALSLSMVFGLMISSRGLDGAVNRKTVLDLHQQWTLSAVVATALYAGVIATDEYVEIGVIGALVPGRAVELSGPVALGTVAFWGMVVVVLSSWRRQRLSYALWRVIHTLAFGTFVVGLAHGLAAGTDTGQPAVQLLYLVSAAVVAAAVIFRLLHLPVRRSASKGGAKGGAKPSAAAASRPASPATRSAPAPAAGADLDTSVRGHPLASEARPRAAVAAPPVAAAGVAAQGEADG